MFMSINLYHLVHRQGLGLWHEDIFGPILSSPNGLFGPGLEARLSRFVVMMMLNVDDDDDDQVSSRLQL